MNGHAIDVYAGCLDQVGLLEMKSLTNSTNGFMVISDSFTTAIFKQSFLRTLGKDDNGYLQMGFNGTFDVIVSTDSLRYGYSTPRLPLLRSSDYKRDQDFWRHRTCHLCQQKVGQCRGDRNRDRTDFGMEGLLPHAEILDGSIFRGRDTRWSASSTRCEWTHTIRYTLSTRVGPVSLASDHGGQSLCRRRASLHRCIVRPRGCCGAYVPYCCVQGRNRRFARCTQVAGQDVDSTVSKVCGLSQRG